MDFTKKVDYRLAKWILARLADNNLIGGAETKVIWQKLIEEFDPSMKSTEVVKEKLPEGRYGSCTEN